MPFTGEAPVHVDGEPRYTLYEETTLSRATWWRAVLLQSQFHDYHIGTSTYLSNQKLVIVASQLEPCDAYPPAFTSRGHGVLVVKAQAISTEQNPWGMTSRARTQGEKGGLDDLINNRQLRRDQAYISKYLS